MHSKWDKIISALVTWIKNISQVSEAKWGRYELIQVTCAEIILSHFEGVWWYFSHTFHYFTDEISWKYEKTCQSGTWLLAPPIGVRLTFSPRRFPYEKVLWYNHGATMVYHGKQWYTMVRCKCTMVQITCTMVNCGIPWYNFSCTVAHPCATMVQRTYTMVHYGIPWYIVSIPWYIVSIPWYTVSILWYLLAQPKYNLREQATSPPALSPLWVPPYLFPPGHFPLWNLLVPWHAVEYDGTSSYHHSTNF